MRSMGACGVSYPTSPCGYRRQPSKGSSTPGRWRGSPRSRPRGARIRCRSCSRACRGCSGRRSTRSPRRPASSRGCAICARTPRRACCSMTTPQDWSRLWWLRVDVTARVVEPATLGRGSRGRGRRRGAASEVSAVRARGGAARAAGSSGAAPAPDRELVRGPGGRPGLLSESRSAKVGPRWTPSPPFTLRFARGSKGGFPSARPSRRPSAGPRSPRAATRWSPRRPARARRSPPSCSASTGSTASSRRRGALPSETDVVYVSPLKALSVDVQQNLEAPLREIAATAAELGLAAPEIRVLVRSGDTPAAARAAMLKRPPHLLITTPESLFLLVTAERSRERLRRVRTLIVDEIHAVARDKRGSHLALTLERLEALCDARPARIGLSATQRPIETIARLLVGEGPGRTDAQGRPACAIVDVGHRRALDLDLVVPGSELEAVASGEQWGEILDDIAGAGREAPHDAGLLEHAAARRARGAPARRTTWRGPGRRPPRQPLEGAPPARRGAPARGRSARARRDRLARARHRHRPGRAGLSARLAAQHRDAAPARRPLRPLAGRHPEGPPLPDHARRAGRERGAAARGAPRAPRPRAPAARAARHPGAADRGRLRRRRLGRGRALRAGAPRGALRRARARGFRRGGRDALRGHPDRARPPRRVSAPRPRERRAARPARRAARGAHLGRRDPRHRRLPRARRSRRHLRRHRQRRLGDREHGGRHLPARHHLLAHPPRRGRRGARERRAGACRRRFRSGSARRPRAPRSSPPRSRRCARRSRRSSTKDDLPGALAWLEAECGISRARGRAGAALPRGLAHGARRAPDPADGSSSSASSTRRAACSSSCTHPFRRAREPRLRARRAQAHLPRLRFRAPGGGQRRRARALARPAALLPAAGLHEDALGAHAARGARAGRAGLADVHGALALEPRALAGGAAHEGRQAQSAADPAHGGRRPDGGGLPRARAVPGEPGRPDRDPGSPAGAPDAARLPARGDGRGRARGAARRDRSGRREPAPARDDRALAARARDPERPARSRFSTTRRSRSAARAPSCCAAACPRRRAISAASIPRRSRACAKRPRRRRGTPRSCTTRCSRWSWRAARGLGAGLRRARARGSRRARRDERRCALVRDRAARRRRGAVPGGALRARRRAPRGARGARAGASPTRRRRRSCAGISTARARSRSRRSRRRRGSRRPQVEQALARLEAEGFALRGSFSPEAAGAEEWLRAAPARAHPSLHARASAARDRAGDRPGLPALPAALAARGAGHAARGPARGALGGRAAPGLRAGGRRLGGGGAAGARRGLPPRMARRALPLGRRGLGAARPARGRRRRGAGARGRARRGGALARDADRVRAARGAAGAARRRARRGPADASR